MKDPRGILTIPIALLVMAGCHPKPLPEQADERILSLMDDGYYYPQDEGLQDFQVRVFYRQIDRSRPMLAQHQMAFEYFWKSPDRNNFRWTRSPELRKEIFRPLRESASKEIFVGGRYVTELVGSSVTNEPPGLRLELVTPNGRYYLPDMRRWTLWVSQDGILERDRIELEDGSFLETRYDYETIQGKRAVSQKLMTQLDKHGARLDEREVRFHYRQIGRWWLLSEVIIREPSRQHEFAMQDYRINAGLADDLFPAGTSSREEGMRKLLEEMD